MKTNTQRTIAVAVLVLVLVILTRPYGYSQTPEKLRGTWVNEQGTRKCDFYSENNKYFGKLSWVADNSRVKAGAVIFRDLVWSGIIFTGKAMTPRGIASCTISFESDDKIKITGSKGAISKSVYWTRVE